MKSRDILNEEERKLILHCASFMDERTTVEDTLKILQSLFAAEKEVEEINEQLFNLTNMYNEISLSRSVEILALKKEIDRLKEFEWMYNDLNK